MCGLREGGGGDGFIYAHMVSHQFVSSRYSHVSQPPPVPVRKRVVCCDGDMPVPVVATRRTGVAAHGANGTPHIYEVVPLALVRPYRLGMVAIYTLVVTSLRLSTPLAGHAIYVDGVLGCIPHCLDMVAVLV